MTAGELAEALGGKRHGRNFMAPCPAHSDSSPSLSISTGDNGSPLVHCFAGCRQDDVISVLRSQGLWSTNGSAITVAQQRQRNPRPTGARLVPAEVVRRKKAQEGWQVVAEYNFSPDLRKVRLEHQERIQPHKARPEKSFLWERKQDGAWYSGKGQLPVPLFVNQLFRDVDQLEFAVGVEGEGKVELANQLGFPSFSFREGDTDAFGVLKDIDVALWPDFDNTGNKKAIQCAEKIRGIARSVRILSPPAELSTAGDIVDAVALGWDAEKIRGLFAAAELFEQDPPENEQSAEHTDEAPASNAERSSRPTIIVNNRQLWEKSDEAVAAFRAYNKPPSIFGRDGKLLRVEKAQTGARIVELDEYGLRNILSASADFFEKSKKGDTTAVSPPMDIVHAVRSRDPVTDLKVPTLDGIISSPGLREDGSLIVKPGYDRKSRVFYAGDKRMSFDIPDSPDVQAVADSVQLFTDLFSEFSLVGKVSFANLMGCLLTPVCMPAIAEPTPLALIDGTTPGAGKSLLAEIASIIHTGKRAVLWPAPRDGEEWRKMLSTALLDNPALLIIDNVKYRLDSEHLCRTLTADTYSDRILGSNTKMTVPVRCTWMATGNNIALGGDMPRRCYRIRLAPKEPHPHRRTKFKIEKIKLYVKAHRQELLTALLIMARYWFANGQPEPEGTLGTFENWHRIIGGILKAANVPEFLGDSEAVMNEVDVESPQWEAFLVALQGQFGSKPFTAANVWTLLNEEQPLLNLRTKLTPTAERLRAAVPDAIARRINDIEFKSRLGNAFRSQKDRPFGPKAIRIERDGEDAHTKVATWKIVEG